MSEKLEPKQKINLEEWESHIFGILGVSNSEGAFVSERLERTSKIAYSQFKKKVSLIKKTRRNCSELETIMKNTCVFLPYGSTMFKQF